MGVSWADNAGQRARRSPASRRRLVAPAGDLSSSALRTVRSWIAAPVGLCHPPAHRGCPSVDEHAAVMAALARATGHAA